MPRPSRGHRRHKVGPRPVLLGGRQNVLCCFPEGPLTVSFKVRDEEFEELASSPGMRPAPYVARYKWVLVEEVGKLSRKEWAHYVRQSYDLVRARLPKKVARQHGLT